jgi:hypothetical protein
VATARWHGNDNVRNGWKADIVSLCSRWMTRIPLILAALVSGCALPTTSHNLMAPPDEQLARVLRGNIWSDLQSNAMIGNGNELAATWANAGSERDPAPALHIEALRCGGSQTVLHCQFGLLRDGGVATYLGESVADRLSCAANFRRSGENGEWSIPRLPPGARGGHSRITIKCQPVS